MEISFSLNDINKAAAMLVESFPSNRVFVFNGGLGAGKTTLVIHLCAVLGVENLVSSPSYSIINEYASPNGSVYHIDLYRLKDEEEAIDAGVEDALYSGNYCFVEWPELASAFLPEDTISVSIEVLPEGKRRLTAGYFHS